MTQNFSMAKIYKITNDYNDDVYIGSTCNTLGRRFTAHKNVLNRDIYKNRPLYKLMNEIGFERFRIEKVLDYPCEDKYQLRQKEGEYIRKIGTLNVAIAGRTHKQWNEENIEKKKEYNKLYEENNKEKRKEQKKINEKSDKTKEYRAKYKENNKEKYDIYFAEYRKTHKEKQKAYYENNKEILLEKQKQYGKEKIKCACGCVYTKSNTRHTKTKKHIDILNKNNLININE